MDRQQLIDALAALDAQLSSVHEVVLVGGAAMILSYGAPRATRDIDVVVVGGDVPEFRRAVSAVARDLGLSEDWVNEGAKGFADVLPPDFPARLAPLGLAFENLRIRVIGLPDLVAMKIVALREQDLEDLDLVLPRLSAAERSVVVQIMHHVGRIRRIGRQKMRYFLEEQGWTVG